jgi:UDP-2,4-diacetamido-2,4,6-trideoxy-beta-L-altropyranose hydrolase
MQIVFRVDASIEIGTGHVMRCLTLANALQKQGANCHFICRDHQGNLTSHIQQSGFTVSILSSQIAESAYSTIDSKNALNHATWLKVDWLTDATQTLEIISQYSVDWLIVDHYGLDTQWESALRIACQHLMVIDDLADRTHNCDVLLDQNLGRKAEDYSELVPENCQLLIGTQFALLRPEFAAIREYSLQRRTSAEIRQLLITMGGVDQPNATGKILNALKECLLPKDCKIIVVMGPHAPWLSEINSIAKTMPWPTEVKFNVNNMAELMANSDLAIGAAGSTSWERCCLGLPSFIIVLAKNQLNSALNLELENAAIVLPFDSQLGTSLKNNLIKIVEKCSIIKKISLQSRNITNGQGCDYVIKEILLFTN